MTQSRTAKSTFMDRRALFARGSAAALLAAVGVSADAAPARGGVLKAALSGGDRAENWLTLPGGRFLQAARNAVFETLTEIAPDGTLQPGLATSWTSSDGGRVWHFTLRDDVVFHEGSQLQSTDAAASLKAAGYHAFADQDSVMIELDQPDPAFPFVAAQNGLVIYRAVELESGGFAQNGTGLYRLKRFDPGRGFLGERVDKHRKDGVAGWFDAIELIAISDDAVRAEAVADGFVDVADLREGHVPEGTSSLQILKNSDHSLTAVRQNIVMGTRVADAPLDDMQFMQRWWSRQA